MEAPKKKGSHVFEPRFFQGVKLLRPAVVRARLKIPAIQPLQPTGKSWTLDVKSFKGFSSETKEYDDYL